MMKNSLVGLSRGLRHFRGLSRSFILDPQVGGALIETAVAVPILSLFLLGVSEFGMASYEAIEVSNAAKAGVQYGTSSVAASTDTTGIGTAAQNDASNITLGTTTVARSYNCSDGTSPTGTYPNLACLSGAAIETILTVQTQASFNPPIHIPGMPSTLTIHGQAAQKVMQ